MAVAIMHRLSSNILINSAFYIIEASARDRLIFQLPKRRPHPRTIGCLNLVTSTTILSQIAKMLYRKHRVVPLKLVLLLSAN